MKRFISLLLCMLMLLSVCGCAKNKEIKDEGIASLLSPPTEIEKINPAESFDITLTFLGDMLLGTNLGAANSTSFNGFADRYDSGYFLEKVRHIFEADDFTLANLEVVLTDRDLQPTPKDGDMVFWFKTKTKNIDIISKSSIEGVLLNNNHTKDYGMEGYNDTVATVQNAGIQYGDSNNTMYFEKNGFKIAVICAPLWGSYNAAATVQRLKQVEQNSHYQIVFFHGGTEKIHEPEQMKVNASRLFVDNGADLVVGGHPHVLQPREIYNGVEIVYSIGNFCYGGHRYPENRTVIYQYKLTVNPKSLAVENRQSNMIPCYVYTGNVNNYQPAIIEDEAVKQRVLDFMDQKTSSPL